MNGVADVRFAGGGIVLPAREPYDRELLVEHVAERVRRKGVVCVAVHGRTYSVHRIDDTVTAACTRCRRPLKGSCATTLGDALQCLRCAFVGSPQSAKKFRAEGDEEARKIRSESDKQVQILLAEARKLADITRGEGDALAVKIFGDACGRDLEFYQLVRTLEAYRKSLGEGTTVILSPGSDFFRFLKQLDPVPVMP